MNITVYLGASEGNDPAFAQGCPSAGHLDRDKREHTGLRRLKDRLDGRPAPRVLAAGGKAIGVEPQCFMDAGFPI